jgi:mediator of RNA polymerase II transcription subunit 5
MLILAKLVGRPLVDDSMLVNYLTNRDKVSFIRPKFLPSHPCRESCSPLTEIAFQGHQEALVIDLTTAAFDVLYNSVHRNESSRTMFLFRTFLVSKLPAFFAAITATSIVPIPIEICIT